ncbi:MAG TPA: phospholipase D family protein [Rudaea sp.]|nr:phospholipase D family protein [Rudaea sp.]
MQTEPHSQAWRRWYALLILVALASACSSLRTSYVKPYSAAFAPAHASPTARLVEPKVHGHAGQSGFRLLVNNNDALMSRVVLADRATHSIDLQYYIFDDDATGRLVAQRLLAAADRGVRVRLLVDDLGVGKAESMLEGLDAHPNVEVRLFNPFRTRAPSFISKIGQFVIDGPRLNRRMHNKSFIVDNLVAIVGGRNIGDAYFEDGQTQHFRDLDVIAIGPVVQQSSRAFDTYWNDKAAYPIAAFGSVKRGDGALERVRRSLTERARVLTSSDYAASLIDALPGGANVDRPGQWLWGNAALVADKPQKVDDGDDSNAATIAPTLDAMIGSAQHELLLVSAYFVPGDENTRYFASLAKRGVAVKLLTNSLAATDEPMVHAGYSRYRRQLLEAGVQIYELRPMLPDQPSAHGTSSGVSLHAKAIVVDRQRVFVGSMNLDLRSRLLNTEMGVLADSPELAAAIADYFDRASLPRNAFHVELDDRGRLTWTSEDKKGERIVYRHEPQVSLKRRVEADFLRLLPIDGLL